MKYVKRTLLLTLSNWLIKIRTIFKVEMRMIGLFCWLRWKWEWLAYFAGITIILYFTFAECRIFVCRHAKHKAIDQTTTKIGTESIQVWVACKNLNLALKGLFIRTVTHQLQQMIWTSINTANLKHHSCTTSITACLPSQCTHNSQLTVVVSIVCNLELCVCALTKVPSSRSYGELPRSYVTECFSVFTIGTFLPETDG